MTKTIRVSDELYEKIKSGAKANKRSLGGQIDWLVVNSLYTVDNFSITTNHDGPVQSQSKTRNDLTYKYNLVADDPTYTDPEDVA